MKYFLNKHDKKSDWIKIRSKGESYFVWRMCVLLWGAPLAVFWTVFMFYFNSNSELWLLIIIAIIIFPAGGYIMGKLLWRQNQKKYK